jgi:hypothetical protein
MAKKTRQFCINETGKSGWIELANGASANFLSYSEKGTLPSDMEMGYDIIPPKYLKEKVKKLLYKFQQEGKTKTQKGYIEI